MAKAAIVLFNLGGPDQQSSIRPFLLNFFSDPNIIRVPGPLRWLIARAIAYRRTDREAGTSYGLLGGKSPLLENTQEQAQALQARLAATLTGFDEVKTFIAMRYWHPLSEQTAAEVKAYAPDQIVLLPLYPQYSTTTTRSSLQAWIKACKAVGLDAPTSTVCCYPFADGFISASAEQVKEAYYAGMRDLAGRDSKPVRVLFSAHGLPESIVAEGDPYQWQCEESARRIAEATGIPALDWQICYQSRVGPKKWLSPSTEDALKQAVADNVPVLIYPHAFVSEHVETLVEIEIEYRELAHELGIKWFGRVPTVSVNEAFIDGLANMVAASIGTSTLTSDQKIRLCPKEFGQCCQAEFPRGV